MRPSAPCDEPFKRVQLHQSTATIFQIGVGRAILQMKEEDLPGTSLRWFLSWDS